MTCTFQKQKRTKGKKSWKETSLQSAHRKVVLHQQSKGESKLKYFFALLKVPQNQIIEKRLCSKKSGAVTSTAKWHTCPTPYKTASYIPHPHPRTRGLDLFRGLRWGGGGGGGGRGWLQVNWTMSMSPFCLICIAFQHWRLMSQRSTASQVSISI